MTKTLPVSLWPVAAELGEGVIWHPDERVVYFVDVKQHQIHRCDASGRQKKTWTVPQQVGFIVPAGNGQLICGLQDGLHHFSPASGEVVRINRVDADQPTNRINDGYADARGQLWFGSMDDEETQPSGRLYSINSAGQAAVHDEGYVISNGPVISPDGRTLYHTDTVNKSIYGFDVQPDHRLTHKRLFLKLDGAGWPDGMAVDSEGCLWIAFFGGWRIDRYTPQAVLIESLPFPCANITKLAFGGEDLRTVFVTTARKGLTPQELEQQPLAGSLFSFRTATPGMRQCVFHWQQS